MKQGNFTTLADNYSKYRPHYSQTVLDSLLGYTGSSAETFLDVGAGTGLWTRMLAKTTNKEVMAVEPCDEMRLNGIQDSSGMNISWKKGNAEETGMADSSYDWVSMASSFHWADFDKATKEFHRVLRDGGVFVALWNPRDISEDPFLQDIEAHLNKLVPTLSRVSSGSSNYVEELMKKLKYSPYFSDMVYIEGSHIQTFTPEQYCGVWESVNDIRAQAGEDKFSQFMSYVREQVKNKEVIETTYKTRAWICRKRS